ncbi:MFS transporter, partial [Bacillus thuringiensis]
QSLFDFSLEKVSLIYIIPYTVSGVIAAFSGTIINKFNMKQTLIVGVTLIIIGLVFGGFLSSLGIAYVLITLTLVNGGYALSFAPLLTRAISTLQESEVGTGIGLFNFAVRIANALGISITAFLLNSKFTEANVFNLSTQMAKYTNIFLVLAMTALIGITVYVMSYKKENGVTKMKKLTIEDVIKELNLVPLTEEGGLVAETYKSEEVYGNRKVGSAIYYFLTKDSFSHLHKLSADEMWHHYYGDPVEIVQIDDTTDEKINSKLGTNLLEGERPQVLVKKHTWQGARLMEGGEHGFALMGTTMSPSYMHNDYIYGKREELVEKFPQYEEDIIKVTGKLIYK